MSVLEVNDFWWKYRSYVGSDNPFTLRGLSFKVDKGEFFGIIGPSGAGKTTLCYALTGVIPHVFTVSPGKESAHVKANLYVASEPAGDERVSSLVPTRLASLVPKLKASSYDYIIFDMPPVSQTSVTARLSGLMDMVLLVIESEKTNQDVVKRANQLLVESKARVSTVLNKTRNYIPPRLHQEFLDNV